MGTEHTGVKDFYLEDVNLFRNKRIVVYGAGKYASFLYAYLNIEHAAENIAFFVVSDTRGNRGSLFGKPVILFDIHKLARSEDILIVAIQQANSVIAELAGMHITNLYYISTDSIEYIKRKIFERYRDLPLQRNKIFFYCYRGLGYRCNCKYIAKKILEDGYPVELVWGLANEENGHDLPDGIRGVVADTKQFYEEVYTSAIIVENHRRDPYVYKKDGQYCIDTWHGTGPFKKTYWIGPKPDVKKGIMPDTYVDLYVAASRFNSWVFRDSFFYTGEIAEWGAPRNDVFFSQNDFKEKICRLLEIPQNKKIVLYAPTFRENTEESFRQYHIDMDKVVNALCSRFHEEFVVLYRFHHMLYKLREVFVGYEVGIDVTFYPDIQELLVAADVVITDYSSLMWDFSLQRRPVFLFQPDEKEYQGSQGFYAPVSEWPYPQAHSMEELLKIIKDFDEETYRRDLEAFFLKYGACDDGHATERVVERIMEKIGPGNPKNWVKVSVIVPVYNVESYLPACLDSILAQTLKEIEVICVDDGSTDRSAAILDEYAKKDVRVRVIHKENRGYGQTMNVGMDAARGEYIGIVESDDCILPRMYECLYAAAKEHDLDLVKSDAVFWWESMDYTRKYHVDMLEAYYDRVLEAADRRVMFDFLMNTWTGIYKRAFLSEHEIRHNETPGASYQDNGFWIQTISFCRRAMWLSEAFYMYRQDNPTASIKSKSKIMVMAEEYDFVAQILAARGKLLELDISRYYKMLRHKGTFIRIADEFKRDYCKEIVKDFEKYGRFAAQNQTAYEWLNHLCRDPEQFCDEFISNKEKAWKQLKQAQNIIIYGAGQRGERALRIFAFHGLSEKVAGFAVSDQKTSAYIGTKPVRCIEEWTSYRDNSVVVIGVKECTDAYAQIKSTLRELGFYNTMDSYWEKYFYHLI